MRGTDERGRASAIGITVERRADGGGKEDSPMRRLCPQA
jgi:hypothetical protein